MSPADAHATPFSPIWHASQVCTKTPSLSVAFALKTVQVPLNGAASAALTLHDAAASSAHTHRGLAGVLPGDTGAGTALGSRDGANRALPQVPVPFETSNQPHVLEGTDTLQAPA